MYGLFRRATGIWLAPRVDALPTASVAFRGQMRLIAGDGAVTNDELYVCRLTSAGTYAWDLVTLT